MQPKFKYLGFAWKKLQQYIYFVSEINLFLDKLHSLDSVCEYLKDVQVPSAAEKDEGEDEGAPIIRAKSKRTGGEPASVPPACEYNNYCCWSLSRGFILPVGEDKGNVLEFNGRRYLFSAPEALQSFRREPEKSLLDIVKVFYDRPEIMIFLERHDAIGHLIRIQDQLYRTTFYGSKDTVCQTEQLSDLSSKIDGVHEIRLLRRRGFQLANQVNYSHSTCQTEVVYYDKYCTGTQTKESRSRCVQTEKEIGTQTGSSDSLH